MREMNESLGDNIYICVCMYMYPYKLSLSGTSIPFQFAIRSVLVLNH